MNVFSVCFLSLIAKCRIDIDFRNSEFVVAENINWIYGTKLAGVSDRRNCILDAFVIRSSHSRRYCGEYVKELYTGGSCSTLRADLMIILKRIFISRLWHCWLNSSGSKYRPVASWFEDGYEHSASVNVEKFTSWPYLLKKDWTPWI